MIKKLALILVLILMSCASQKDMGSLPFEVLVENEYGGFDNAQTIAIKDQDELAEIYSQINKTRKPGFTLPKIDFKEEMVLALFMGQKNSGGYVFHISKIVETDAAVEVFYKTSSPEGMATMAITQPFYICKTKRVDKEVIFKKSE